MGNLLRDARTDTLKGPQQRQFKFAEWEKAFDALNQNDEVDASLFHAVRWFSATFDNLRDVTKLANEKLACLADRSLFFVGIATREWLVVRNKISGRISENGSRPIFLEELDTPFLNSLSGSNVSPSEVIETLVDAIRYPLSLAAPKFESPQMEADQREALRAAGILFVTGHHLQEQNRKRPFPKLF